MKEPILTDAGALATAVDEPLLAIADIQGNVVPGFNKNEVQLLFLRIDDRVAAKGWLKQLMSDIASTREVLAFNRLFKETRERRDGLEGTVKSTWINIAFSYRGLSKLSPR